MPRPRALPRLARFIDAPAGDPGAGAPASTTTSKTPEYTPPASQADLDRIIGERLARERAKYADYDALKAKAEQFDAAQEASKTTEQKTADRIAELEAKSRQAEARAAAAEAAAMRAEVAAAKGVPAAFITGDSREDALKAADELLAWKNTAAPASAPTGTAAAWLGPGAQAPQANGSTHQGKGGGLAAGRALYEALTGSRRKDT